MSELADLNDAAADALRPRLLALTASPAWADALLAARPLRRPRRPARRLGRHRRRPRRVPDRRRPGRPPADRRARAPTWTTSRPLARRGSRRACRRRTPTPRTRWPGATPTTRSGSAGSTWWPPPAAARKSSSPAARATGQRPRHRARRGARRARPDHPAPTPTNSWGDRMSISTHVLDSVVRWSRRRAWTLRLERVDGAERRCRPGHHQRRRPLSRAHRRSRARGRDLPPALRDRRVLRAHGHTHVLPRGRGHLRGHRRRSALPRAVAAQPVRLLHLPRQLVGCVTSGRGLTSS